MTTPCSFSVSEGLDEDAGKVVRHGCFSRDWGEEEELDAMLDDLKSGRASQRQALLQAQKLVAKLPNNLEVRNFLANRFWDLEMRDEAADVWQQAYQEALAAIPKGFKGLITWSDVDNRSFLRVAHGHLLGLMHQGKGKPAMALAKKLLAWCPMDNLGVRMLLGDISLMLGDSKAAIKHFLREAAFSPAHWYQAGQITFRAGDYVSACTYIRRGIAANPYIAEGLTGRTTIEEHLYWHGSNRYGPEWAVDYLGSPVCVWSPEETDFVDWVFNSAVVLRERAEVMSFNEGLTYEHEPDRREPFARRSTFFVEGIADDVSASMVRKVRNRYGVEIWPWDRAGL